MNVLLVENQEAFAETVATQFLGDHMVTVVSTVMEALDHFRQSRFDVVLVDYDLDDFKGDVFVRRVRDTGSRLPIIGISARDDGNRALSNAGADAVCHKARFNGIRDVLGALWIGSCRALWKQGEQAEDERPS